MPAYKYNGPYPTYFSSGLPTASGSGEVLPGAVVELDSPPFGLYWTPVEDAPEKPAEPALAPPVAIAEPAPPAAPAPVPEPAPAAVVVMAANPYTQPPAVVH